MSLRNLEYLFEPQSVAVINVSANIYGVGTTVLNNLYAGGSKGRFMRSIRSI